MAVRIEERKVDAEGKGLDRYKRGIIVHCDSAMDLVGDAVAKALAEHTKVNLDSFEKDSRGGSDWYDYVSYDEAMQGGATGDDRHIKDVLAVMNNVEAAVGSTSGREWQKSVVGSFPNVPAAIIGHPRAMYRNADESHDRAPITVWFNTVSSGGWDAKQLAKRGAAVVAFLLKLAEVRPVRLNMMMHVGQSSKFPNFTIVVPIDVRTINVAQFAGMACVSGWHRWQYNLAQDFCGADLSWDALFYHHGSNPTNPEFIRDMKEYLGAEPQDIYIPQAYLSDDMVRNPVAWVKRTLALYAAETETA